MVFFGFLIKNPVVEIVKITLKSLSFESFLIQNAEKTVFFVENVSVS